MHPEELKAAGAALFGYGWQSRMAELQGLAEHIAPNDVELLEWAGVPEFPEDEN